MAVHHDPIPLTCPCCCPCAVSSAVCSGGVSIEWQRQRAKEMRQYFQDKQLEVQAQKRQ
jgi:hypothetical protein